MRKKLHNILSTVQEIEFVTNDTNGRVPSILDSPTTTEIQNTKQKSQRKDDCDFGYTKLTLSCVFGQFLNSNCYLFALDLLLVVCYQFS